jgi:hypothetical protein
MMTQCHEGWCMKGPIVVINETKRDGTDKKRLEGRRMTRTKMK